MRRRIVSISLFVVFILCFTGCAVFNPYSDEFQCPNVDKGECISMQNAYEKSISSEQDNTDDESLQRDDECTDCAETGKSTTDTQKETTKNAGYNYQKSLYNKMISLIQNSRSPMVAAPDVMRVLIMAYTGPGNILYSYR
jgi:type IV conjugative transfer system lipoprotein TraV